MLQQNIKLIIEPILNRYQWITKDELLTYKYSIENNIKEEDLRLFGPNSLSSLAPSAFLNGTFDLYNYPAILVEDGFGPRKNHNNAILLDTKAYHFHLRKNYLFVDDNAHELYSNVYKSIKEMLK